MIHQVTMRRGLVWLRNDLRLNDNSALYQASTQCRELAAVFIASPGTWQNHNEGDPVVAFRIACLRELQIELEDRNIPLYFIDVPFFAQIPEVLQQIVERLKIDAIYTNAEYPLNEQRRDTAVKDLLKKDGVKVQFYSDRTLIPPGAVRTREGEPYKVFTPFKRALIQLCADSEVKTLPRPRKIPAPGSESHWPKWMSLSGGQKLSRKIPTQLPHYTIGKSDNTGFIKGWRIGEKAAQKKLKKFSSKIFSYQVERDFPALDGTSCLSPYLNSGAISIRQCIAMALSLNEGHWLGGNDGVACWISELIWRDFYTHLLVDFPRLSKGKPFKEETDQIPWSYNQDQFKRWSRGDTGVPIVDAAMRQLNETAWMHNRLRMVVASFLSKNMLIDWRWGERYFMQRLIDADFASNNGGWQWTASTGTDAAPYFRVFNPYRQSQRFDPNGSFIRKYAPELKGLSDKAIHDPPPTQGYPQVICDVGAGRKRAIEVFANLK
ncbi:DNA photolyase family protein [Microbulbifer sp. OS29]|uniref:Deoxyribodipyrimidine photo-lyase n=1 Tax=Microbulbifer okhotskensis TaxID=2926617 RepID=A0A9X2EJ29_9GAMM|nr:deoxyribodipyrimidine photo-lyase [Microbulbifer okhotskensis]MCO1333184.1 DNA photolyase family protein [Microbulbifer okhotskensis]